MDIDFNDGFLDELAHSDAMGAMLHRVGAAVQNRARDNVRDIYHGTQLARGIRLAMGHNADGPYVDVGYAKSHEGFVLWWSELGAGHTPPKPHLRRALEQHD